MRWFMLRVGKQAFWNPSFTSTVLEIYHLEPLLHVVYRTNSIQTGLSSLSMLMFWVIISKQILQPPQPVNSVRFPWDLERKSYGYPAFPYEMGGSAAESFPPTLYTHNSTQRSEKSGVLQIYLRSTSHTCVEFALSDWLVDAYVDLDFGDKDFHRVHCGTLMFPDILLLLGRCICLKLCSTTVDCTESPGFCCFILMFAGFIDFHRVYLLFLFV